MRTVLLALIAAAAVGADLSTEKEIALGRQVAGEFEKLERVSDDAVITQYVRQLADRLAQAAALHVPLTVRVIETSEPRVMVFPGGYIYVSLGAIARANAQSKFAGMLAHAIAHVAARHSSQGWTDICPSSGRDVLIPLGLRTQIEKFESEANTLAEGYLRSSPPDPSGGERFTTVKERVLARPEFQVRPRSKPTLRRPLSPE